MECIREGHQSASFVLEVSLQEADEDHLGVTLIRSGDSVIIMKEALRWRGRIIRYMSDKKRTWVEPR